MKIFSKKTEKPLLKSKTTIQSIIYYNEFFTSILISFALSMLRRSYMWTQITKANLKFWLEFS